MIGIFLNILVLASNFPLCSKFGVLFMPRWGSVLFLGIHSIYIGPHATQLCRGIIKDVRVLPVSRWHFSFQNRLRRLWVVAHATISTGLGILNAALGNCFQGVRHESTAFSKTSFFWNLSPYSIVWSRLKTSCFWNHHRHGTYKLNLFFGFSSTHEPTFITLFINLIYSLWKKGVSCGAEIMVVWQWYQILTGFDGDAPIRKPSWREQKLIGFVCWVLSVTPSSVNPRFQLQ